MGNLSDGTLVLFWIPELHPVDSGAEASTDAGPAPRRPATKCTESGVVLMSKATSDASVLRELRQRREEILRLASRHGARNVRVFGSTLHGRTTRESDVDLLVDLEEGRNLLDLGGLQMDLQDLLDRPVDLKTEASLREDIRERVTEEAVEL